MKLDQGQHAFKERWMLRTGDKTEFARGLSPLVREGCLPVREMPEKLTAILLDGIRVDARQRRPRRVIWQNILPLMLCALLAVFLPVFAWAKVLMILLGAAVSVWMAYIMNASGPAESEISIEIDGESLEQALELSEEMLKAYIEYLRGIEQDMKLGHDVTKNRFFGEWIQKFVAHTLRHEENSSLQRLRDELVELLDSMGITVYYELEKNEEGGLNLPDEEYYTDERSGGEFTQVKKPIVYSRRRLLARGTIR